MKNKFIINFLLIFFGLLLLWSIYRIVVWMMYFAAIALVGALILTIINTRKQRD